MRPNSWHLMTAKYPPQFGGVSDYTRQVALGLADAGDEVHVWCPAPECEEGKGKGEGEKLDVRDQKSEVRVHRHLGRVWPTDLRRVGRMLDQFPAPRRLLVQWVPHGFGMRAMNVPFSLWLWKRARKGDVVEIMAHECYLPFKRWAWKQNTAAVVQRLMTIILLRAAHHVWVSIPAWEKRWRPLALGRRVTFTWLPVPSNIPVIEDPVGVSALRKRYGINGQPVIGHFGTYNQHDRKMLRLILTKLFNEDESQKVILIGRGSDAMRDDLIQCEPKWKNLIHASGALDADQLSVHLSACDVMVQPCQGGVSGRKTTVIAGLAHGRQIVTTTGCLTESDWAASKAVVLAPCDDVELIAAETRRLLNHHNRCLGQAARDFYDRTFDVSRTISVLRCT